jgi:hypothetical protein
MLPNPPAPPTLQQDPLQAPPPPTYLAPEKPTAEQQEHMTPEYWAKEMAASKKWLQKWHTNAKAIERKYLLAGQDARGDSNNNLREPSRFPLFWSNVQTTLAAMYGQIPKVDVDRSNLDPGDDVARVAAMILERIFQFEADDLENSPYYVMQDCILDRLVAGLGVAWARYEFKSQEFGIDGMNNADGTPMMIPIITEERAPLDYVRWVDFLFSPCKRWQERRWVARRVPMTAEALRKRFGEAASGVPMALKSSAVSRAASDDDPLRAITEDMADVWEIWCGTTRWAYWYVQGHDKLLDAKEDPLKLTDFFPVRRPLCATTLTKAYIPKPDYDYARSQYDELDLIAARTGMLTDALKLVGVYDKAAEGVQRMLNQAAMNQLIPVDNWAMFAEKGGIKGQVDWMPLDMVVSTLQYLVQRKQTLSQEVFELLGISDIQRGMAATKETATTQRLKAQFGSARAARGSEEVARFVTDNYRMRAEIICKHWQPQTILYVSQIDKTPDKDLAQQAVELLKKDPSVAMRVKISADNVTAPDWELEKGQRVEFLQAVSGFIGATLPMVQQSPGTGPFVIQMLQWTAAGFKAGKSIEGVLDQALAAMQADKAKGPPPPPPPSAFDKKEITAAEENRASAQKEFAEAVKTLVELGIDPMMAAQQLQMFGMQNAQAVANMQAPKPQGAPGAPGGPPPGAMQPGGPPPPGGAPTGGFPPRPPGPMPALPGAPGL